MTPGVVPRPPEHLPRPPRLARGLLRLLLHEDDRDAAISDLDEEFESRARDHGRSAAARWYRAQVLRSLGPVWHRRWSARAGLPLVNECRWAARSIRSRGAGAVVYVALVAIAVGASTLAFAAADAFVFNRAPYPHAGRVVLFERTTPIGVYSTLQPDEWQYLRGRSDLFGSLHSHGNASNGPVSVTIGGAVETVWLHHVTPGLFDALGVIPPLGRPLREGDGLPGVPAAAVVAWPLATRWFGEPARAVGQTIQTGDEVIRIVGVMPDGFRFPTRREEVWSALRSDPSRPFGMSLGWLAPGATAATVQSALDGRRVGPDDEPGPVGPLRVVPLTRAMHDPRVRTNSGAYTGATAPALFTILFAAAICLTAVSSLNLAGLSLASALTRAHVHAVQTALGATRSLLVRVALLEAWALTLAGAAAGYVAARWSTAAMQAAMPSPLEALLLNAIDVDVRAVWFMALATATTGMLACAPLVWLTSRGGLTDALRRSSRTASASRTHVAWRHGIVGVQAAMTVVLLSGAVVFLRPFISDFAADQQFDTTGLVTINVAESSDVSREERDRTRNRLHERVLETLRAHPLVRSVAPVSEVPPGVGRATPPSHLWIAGHAASAGLIHLASINGGEGSLDTLGVRLLAGRAFQAGDTADRVIVDIEFARRFWPAGNALGARFSTGTETTPGKNTREIIGIASHLRPGRAWSGQPVFVVHSLSPPRLSYAARLHRTAAMEAVAAAVRQIAPGARATVRSVADEYADMDGDTRIAVSLASSFAAIALVVAIAGIYGVTAFVVAGRTREIGIRLALGATPPDIRRSIVRPTMRVVGLGLGAGVGLALLTSRWIESLPLGVTGAGAAASVAIALGVGAAAILAARRPAGRASRVNPAITLRAE